MNTVQFNELKLGDLFQIPTEEGQTDYVSSEYVYMRVHDFDYEKSDRAVCIYGVDTGDYIGKGNITNMDDTDLVIPLDEREYVLLLTRKLMYG